MGIAIRPLVVEDIPTFVRIELEAFRSHPRIPMLWRNGYTDDLYAYYESGKNKHFNEPEGRFIKAVDDETGEIVGCCEATFALDPTKNAQEEPMDPNEPPPENWPVGGNWEMRRFYTINSHKLLVESFAGKPYILVEILVVHPKYHGRGIGSKLLSWAVAEADKGCVSLGLESTPAGLSLYKRHGFEVRQTIKADMRLFGWDMPYDEEAAKRVWMVREPRTAH